MQAEADPRDSQSLGERPGSDKMSPSQGFSLITLYLYAAHSLYLVLFPLNYFSLSKILSCLLNKYPQPCTLHKSPKVWICLFCHCCTPCLVWHLVQSRHLIHICAMNEKSSLRCGLQLQPNLPGWSLVVLIYPARGRVVRCRWTASGAAHAEWAENCSLPVRF